MRHLVESPTPWALPVFCLGEFVRVVTHPRVFDPPSSMEEALAALDAFLASPSVRLLLPGEQFAAMLLRCLRESDARGNIALDIGGKSRRWTSRWPDPARDRGGEASAYGGGKGCPDCRTRGERARARRVRPG
jgi:hypothetical protein